MKKAKKEKLEAGQELEAEVEGGFAPEPEPEVEPVPAVEPPTKAKYYENLFRGGK